MTTRVLWVSAEVPHHTGWGGTIRQAHLLGALAEHAEVDLVVPRAVADDRVRAACRRVVEVLDAPEPRSETPVERRLRTLVPGPPGTVRRAGARTRALGAAMPDPSGYDAVVLQHAELGPLLGARPSAASPRWVLELHYLPSVWHTQAAASCGPRQRAFHRVEARHARRAEGRWLRDADRVVVCSAEDASALGGGVVVGNGVDLDRWEPSPVPAAPRLVFVGHLGYEPNIDAVEWLADEIVPRVRARVGQVEVDVVGRDPLDVVRRSADRGGLSLHADVPDVTPHLAAARVALVPIRIGSGTRLKALEAMAAGRPVVGTAVGLEGLGVVPGRDAAVADDPDAFATEVVRLLTDDRAATELAAAGRRLAEDHGWRAMGERYVEAVLG